MNKYVASKSGSSNRQTPGSQGVSDLLDSRAPQAKGYGKVKIRGSAPASKLSLKGKRISS